MSTHNAWDEAKIKTFADAAQSLKLYRRAELIDIFQRIGYNTIFWWKWNEITKTNFNILLKIGSIKCDNVSSMLKSH
jgi:hypothetical protein